MPEDNKEVKMVYITESEFNDLVEKDPNTVYFVVSDVETASESN